MSIHNLIDAARSHDRHSPRTSRGPNFAFECLMAALAGAWLFVPGVAFFGWATWLTVLGVAAVVIGLQLALLTWAAKD